MIELKDLTQAEELALIGLIKAVIQADKTLSVEENVELKRLAAMMGPERFHERVEEARTRFIRLSDIKAHAKTIDRQPARQLIFNLLLQMAKGDEVIPEEEELLSWIAELWDLEFFRK